MEPDEGGVGRVRPRHKLLEVEHRDEGVLLAQDVERRVAHDEA